MPEAQRDAGDETPSDMDGGGAASSDEGASMRDDGAPLPESAAVPARGSLKIVMLATAAALLVCGYVLWDMKPWEAPPKPNPGEHRLKVLGRDDPATIEREAEERKPWRPSATATATTTTTTTATTTATATATTTTSATPSARP